MMARRQAAIVPILRFVSLALPVFLAVFLAIFLAIKWLPPTGPDVGYRPAGFSALDGWAGDDHLAALRVFNGSCGKLVLGPDGGAWRKACAMAAEISREATADTARSFFEDQFVAAAVHQDGNAQGLFTGYFEPEYEGSRSRRPGYQVPLYRRPVDLVTVDLGAFRADLAGRRIAGRVAGGRLEPYGDRTQIEGGAVAGRGLEIAWLRNPVDAFFLQIQGSGRIRLDDGTVMRIGFAGHNGHPYTAIGGWLDGNGDLAGEDISMQSIRRWLEANPERAAQVMARNASYIFFREIDGPGPIGTMGVALTPGRSLAVDPRHVRLGAPVWLETAFPDGQDMRPLRRLMVAQDTGGAIKGAVRGDVFWGPGAGAGEVAGRMKSSGRYYVLLPRALLAELGGGRP